MSEVLTIVVPMAGRGSRFADAGYDMPKPLIDVAGRTMIEWVIENLRPSRAHRFVFLCLTEHIGRFDVAERLTEWAPGCEVVPVSGVTEGAACTVLLARELIDGGGPLMIANSDQWVTARIDDYLAETDAPETDGLIMTMKANDPKWSFARLDDHGLTLEVVEKVVVSDEATVGIYNFARGSAFVSGADSMIKQDLRVNGEFYVAPVYNELISAGATIRVHNIGDVENAMWGLGTPTDLDAFLGSSHAHAKPHPESA
jgi:NDP-sugar pyrophosphorylase family protein